MLSMYLVYYVAGVVSNLLIVIFVVLVSVAAIGAIVWAVYSTDRHCSPYSPKEHPRRYSLFQKGRKYCMGFTIAALIFIPLLLTMPSKEEAMVMMALKTGDDYFKKNPNSALSPQKVIGTFDSTAEELEKFMVKLPKILNKSIDLADKKLTKLEK